MLVYTLRIISEIVVIAKPKSPDVWGCPIYNWGIYAAKVVWVLQPELEAEDDHAAGSTLGLAAIPHPVAVGRHSCDS